MMQVALHQFPTTSVKYEFKCRNKNADKIFDETIVEEIYKQIEHYCSLMFTEEELNYLSSIRFFKKDFVDFLSLYKPNLAHVTVYLDKENYLHIEVEGPWFLTLPFEVPILAIVSEVYFCNKEFSIPKWNSKLNKKIETFNYWKYSFSDFGTRRRFSFDIQEEVIKKLKNECLSFKGTSNLYFAKKFNLTAIGTMAHEFIMAGAGQNDVPLVKSQQRMLQAWVNEYRGDLGIALTDTYGVDAFIRDFDLYFAKLYDGVRHDSGDPITWACKMIAHYEDLGIDLKTKTFVFSDGLTPEYAAQIYRQLKNVVNCSFGIGTNLTNDVGFEPLQNVMKITKCNGRPVAKISDSPGKGMCHDEEYLSYVRKVFEIK